MGTQHRFGSYSLARRHLKDVLDSALDGRITTVRRDSEQYLVISAELQRALLAKLIPSNAQVVSEGGGWAVLIPGLPVHGDAPEFNDAVGDAVEALREYADDWNERLHTAPNHADNRGIVELIEVSNDDQLRDWLLGDTTAAAPAADHLQPA